MKKNDVKIKVNTENRQVYFDDNFLGVNSENLQSNLVFEFDGEFVNGSPRVEVELDGNKYIITELSKVGETYVMPIKSSLLKTSQIWLQLVITESGDNEISIFKSRSFYLIVSESINAETELPDEYETLYNKIQSKIAEVENLNIEAEKEKDKTTINITDKLGNTKEIEILDGKTPIKGIDYFTEEDIESLGINEVKEEVEEIRENYGIRLDRLDNEETGRVKLLENRSENLENRTENVEERLYLLDNPRTGRVPLLETKTNNIDKRTQTLETSVNVSIPNRFDGVENRLDNLDDSKNGRVPLLESFVNGLNARTQYLENRTNVDIPNEIQNIRNSFLNYYLKKETYNQQEINQLIGSIKTASMKVVPERPQTGETNIIYLVPSSKSTTENIYEEWIYVENKWELIGSTQADLSNYYTKDEMNQLLFDYITSNDLEEALENYANISEIERLDDRIDNIDLTNYVKNTDFATTGKPGIIKANTTYATSVSSTTASLMASVITAINYKTANNNAFISKGTLENVLIDKGLTTTIVTSITNNTLVLNNHQEARLGELATLILTMPSTIGDIYETNLTFISGDTATSLNYSATPIKWVGDDCDSEQDFVPEPNKIYEISIKKVDSTNIIARVGAF